MAGLKSRESFCLKQPSSWRFDNIFFTALDIPVSSLKVPSEIFSSYFHHRPPHLYFLFISSNILARLDTSHMVSWYYLRIFLLARYNDFNWIMSMPYSLVAYFDHPTSEDAGAGLSLLPQISSVSSLSFVPLSLFSWMLWLEFSLEYLLMPGGL